MSELSAAAWITSLVAHYNSEAVQVALANAEASVSNIFETKSLKSLLHSHKTRIKATDSLAKKLELKKAKNPEFNPSPQSLMREVTDCLGARILHLCTDEFPKINSAVQRALQAQEYELLEGPFVRVWDDETKDRFRAWGIEIQPSERLYTSVHYVYSISKQMSFELQVRTLSEEIWGEVDHRVRYKAAETVPNADVQVKVLARATSTVTRLVDSIFDAAHVRK